MKLMLFWNIVLTILLLMVWGGLGVRQTDNTIEVLDSHAAAIEDLRKVVKNNADVMQEVATALDARDKVLADQVEKQRQFLLVVGEVVKAQNEYLNRQSTDLDKLIMLLKLAGAF